MLEAIFVLVWIRVLALLPEMLFNSDVGPWQQVAQIIVAILIAIALAVTLLFLFDTSEIPDLGY